MPTDHRKCCELTLTLTLTPTLTLTLTLTTDLPVPDAHGPPQVLRAAVPLLADHGRAIRWAAPTLSIGRVVALLDTLDTHTTRTLHLHVHTHIRTAVIFSGRLLYHARGEAHCELTAPHFSGLGCE